MGILEWVAREIYSSGKGSADLIAVKVGEDCYMVRDGVYLSRDEVADVRRRLKDMEAAA